MSSLVYRRAEPEDLVAVDDLVVACINDLTERHGFGSMATASPPNFQLFSLKDDPGGLWVAEDNGDILGFAWSWVCADLWFLAQLFVRPGEQGRGIGKELLGMTLKHARQSGASHRALITFTFNRVSQGLYIRHGLYPKMPVYLFSGKREIVLAGLQNHPLHTVALESSGAHMAILAEIDRQAVGTTREKHHRYLLQDPSILGVLLCAGSECIGYTYANSNGHIGPFAVTRDDVLGDAFSAALKIAADCSSANVSAFLPGTCTNALCTAVNCGMQITFPMLLMASAGYGDWTRYMPRNPGFM